MKRAIQVTEVSRRALIEAPDLMSFVTLPPYPWFVRGPRGGLYVATGANERYVTESVDGFLRNTVCVVDKSEGIKYVRPGSRLHKEGTA